MDPFTIAALAALGLALLKSRGQDNGAAGNSAAEERNASPMKQGPATGSPQTQRVIGADRAAPAQQAVPVSSEMSLGTRPTLSFQSPLYPAGAWSGYDPMGMGRETLNADDASIFPPPQANVMIDPSAIGSVADWSEQNALPPSAAPLVSPTTLDIGPAVGTPRIVASYSPKFQGTAMEE